MSNLPRKIFVNLYSPFAGSIGSAYATRELADQMAARSRLACVEVDLDTCTTTVLQSPRKGLEV
jgi:hypothetical protein